MLIHSTKTALVGLALLASFGAPAATRTFTNATAIPIDAAQPGPVSSLASSSIAVSGLGGSISNVTISLHNASASYVGRIDVLLHAPGGQNILLIGQPGTADFRTSGDFVNGNISFNANAASILPALFDLEPPNVIPSGTYLPSVRWSSGNLPIPAPVGPYSTNMASLYGSGAAQNGNWQLWIANNGTEDDGLIAGGWSVTVQGFFGCAAEGYTGTKRTLCHQVCEVNYPPIIANALIRAWIRLYRTEPPCAAPT